jgi:serine/threonine protein phosphatase 1
MLSIFRKLLSKGGDETPIYPGLSEDVVLYVVGDIHGCLEPLRRTHAAIDLDRTATSPGIYAEIYLGDYVDRGPDSSGVIDCLARRAKSHPTVFIKGNHDTMMEEFASGRRALSDWLPYGCADTLRSYGASAEAIASGAEDLPKLIPSHHQDFLSSCEYSYEVYGYFFTHAGVRPGRPLHQQSPEDLMWIRDDFLRHRGSFGAIVVHGHTPVPEAEFKPNRIGIDTGAYMTGQLSCLRIDREGPRMLKAGAKGL